MIYRLLRPLLFAMDAEEAHELAVSHVLRLQQMPVVMRAIAAACRPPAALRRTLWGLEFPSPVGIAAGFDKNAVMMPFLAAIGFGFLEVGTVTLHPQPGNPRPRIFRYAAYKALVNRLGFNNDGADAVAERLQRWRADDHQTPLFVNVGKNRDVPIDHAGEAYAQCYMRVARWADGCVLNLSSPNTPALRELQRPEHLERLLGLVRSIREQMPFDRPGVHPILVKIAPDLEPSQVHEICDVAKQLADGMVCTNTTIEKPQGITEDGGLSGKPLFEKSTAIVEEVRRVIPRDLPVIGLGGVFNADDARRKLEAGADLVQVYTGMVYEGPWLAARIARQLAKDEG